GTPGRRDRPVVEVRLREGGAAREVQRRWRSRRPAAGVGRRRVRACRAPGRLPVGHRHRHGRSTAVLLGARPANARQRAARFRRHMSGPGTDTGGMLLELPQTLNRDRLIEKIIGAAEGTPGWVLDAWAEAEEHRRTAARDRLARPAPR